MEAFISANVKKIVFALEVALGFLVLKFVPCKRHHQRVTLQTLRSTGWHICSRSRPTKAET
jgi:hypothetical protein